MPNEKRSHTPMIIAVVAFICAIAVSIYTAGGLDTFKTLGGLADTPVISTQASAAALTTNEHPLDKLVAVDGEMMAVWVPFMTLSMENEESKDESAFKAKFENIIEVAKKNKMNALIVHVRPFGDAMYESGLFPWSHILTGEQGQNPGYDPLAIMIEAAHAAGLQFHAWINPLRIQNTEAPKALSDSNPATAWGSEDGRILAWENGLYYNPASDEVRKHIIDGVAEIVENYAVDGIHFDDYFYPTSDSDFDKSSYTAYVEALDKDASPLPLLEWRTSNINSLIAGVYGKIKSINQEVVFGISPQANIENNTSAGADVAAWSSTDGYVDYICPQIYMNFEHTLLPFDKSLDQWLQLVTNKKVKLYIGLALYKAGSTEDDGTWQNSNDIIKNQIELGREKGVDGFMFYSWAYLEHEDTSAEVAGAVNII